MAMNPQPNGPGPAQSRENYRHSMEEWRQSALSQRNQYEPRVKEQVTRSFQEYSPPLYASIIGYRRDWNLLVATSRVSGFAATLGRDLDNEEAKAIAEYTLNNIHTNASLKWLSVAVAGYMTYRGRRTWQFPFYKPKLGGRFNPNETTSIFSNKKIRGPWPRATWHCLRFTAYLAVTMLMVEPAFRAVNFIRTEAAMTHDPRLKQFTKDASKRVEQVMSNPTISKAPFTGRNAHRSDENDPWAGNDGNSNDGNNASSESSYQPTPTQSWDKSPSYTTTQQSQQPSDDWSVLDDDDASPVASSARKQPVSSSSGSAWDRVRQQSYGAPRQQQQQSNSQSQGWAARPQPEAHPQSQTSWGNESAGGSGDSFSLNKPDEESVVAKEQAQNEFDRLVERERKGQDQEKSWGRK